MYLMITCDWVLIIFNHFSSPSHLWFCELFSYISWSLIISSDFNSVSGKWWTWLLHETCTEFFYIHTILRSESRIFFPSLLRLLVSVLSIFCIMILFKPYQYCKLSQVRFLGPWALFSFYETQVSIRPIDFFSMLKGYMFVSFVVFIKLWQHGSEFCKSCISSKVRFVFSSCYFILCITQKFYNSDQWFKDSMKNNVTPISTEL